MPFYLRLSTTREKKVEGFQFCGGGAVSLLITPGCRDHLARKRSLPRAKPSCTFSSPPFSFVYL